MFSLFPFLCGDSLSLMERMDNDCYHAVVTDPPYASGGVFRHYLKPSDKMHLTGKPVPLMRHLMTVLPPASRVLDPFMGSGTTLVAARDLGHVAHGIDLSPDNVRIAADRLGVPVP